MERLATRSTLPPYRTTLGVHGLRRPDFESPGGDSEAALKNIELFGRNAVHTLVNLWI